MTDKQADDDRPVLEIVPNDEAESHEPAERPVGGPPEPDRRADPRHRGPW